MDANRDEPPQEPEGKVWVSFTFTLRGGSIMADRSAEYWWSLFVSPEREQPGAESVGRGTGCWGRVGRRFPDLNPDFLLSSFVDWHVVWLVLGPGQGGSAAGDPSIHRASVTEERWGVCSELREYWKRLKEPEVTADVASVLRLWDSWTSSTKQTALVSVRLWWSIKWVKLILQAWCCQMFSIRSVGNVVRLTNRLTHSAV